MSEPRPKLNPHVVARIEGKATPFVAYAEQLAQQASDMNAATCAATFEWLNEDDELEPGEYVPELVIRVRRPIRPDGKDSR